MTERQTCGDCGAKEGQLHVLGCDMEPCPACGGQLISCDCDEYMALVEAERAGKLKSKKRIPFIVYPNLCAKCGTLWPDMFNVPDAEWEHYIEPKMRGEILCKACYLQIKAWIDGEAVAAVNHAKILFAHHRHGHGSRQLADYLDNIGVSRHQAR